MDLLKLQGHQIIQADQGSTTETLKIKLLLKPQPRKVGQELHTKPKQHDSLLK